MKNITIVINSVISYHSYYNHNHNVLPNIYCLHTLQIFISSKLMTFDCIIHII